MSESNRAPTDEAVDQGDADQSAASPAYRGVFGAFPYAYRTSESRLLRSYVVLGGLVAAFLALTMALSVLVLLGSTAGVAGGTFTLSRAFFVVVALFVVVPTIAPVLLVARRHRRRSGTDRRYDAAMAATGYLFVLSLYLALLVSAPPDARSPPPAAVAPLVNALYDLPAIAGLVPPAVAAATILYAHRALR